MNRVYITGMGLIMGTQVSGDGRCRYIDPGVLAEIDADPNHRYLDRVSKLSMMAVQLALQDRGPAVTKEQAIDYGLILGTEYGVLDSIHHFDLTALEKGPLAVSPMLFPNTVLSSAACQMSIRFSLAGPVYTVNNGFTSSLDAVGVAYQHVKQGLAPLMLAGGVDEITPLSLKIHQRTMQCAEASGFICIENGLPGTLARPLAEILEFHSAGGSGENWKERGNSLIQALQSSSGDGVWSPMDVDCVFCGTAYPEAEGVKIMERVCKNTGIQGKLKYSSMDVFGAIGIVQIIQALQSEPGQRVMIVNLDQELESALFIKTYNKECKQ